jgi:hypothetical protein
LVSSQIKNSASGILYAFSKYLKTIDPTIIKDVSLPILDNLHTIINEEETVIVLTNVIINYLAAVDVTLDNATIEGVTFFDPRIQNLACQQARLQVDFKTYMDGTDFTNADLSGSRIHLRCDQNTLLPWNDIGLRNTNLHNVTIIDPNGNETLLTSSNYTQFFSSFQGTPVFEAQK